jgi:hypothetical protein
MQASVEGSASLMCMERWDSCKMRATVKKQALISFHIHENEVITKFYCQRLRNTFKTVDSKTRCPLKILIFQREEN